MNVSDFTAADDHCRCCCCTTPLLSQRVPMAQSSNIVHDAEYYVSGSPTRREVGRRKTSELDAKLAELRKKHGTPPNIVHIMWDDTAFGDVGIPCHSDGKRLRRLLNLNQDGQRRDLVLAVLH